MQGTGSHELDHVGRSLSPVIGPGAERGHLGVGQGEVRVTLPQGTNTLAVHVKRVKHHPRPARPKGPDTVEVSKD